MSQHHSCFSVTAYGHAALFLNRIWILSSCVALSCSTASFSTSRYKQCFFNNSWEYCAFSRSAVGIHKIKAARCCTGTRSPLCCCLCLCQSPEYPSWSCYFPCGVRIVGAEGTGIFGRHGCYFDFVQGLYLRLGRQLYYNGPYLLRYFA